MHFLSHFGTLIIEKKNKKTLKEVTKVMQLQSFPKRGLQIQVLDLDAAGIQFWNHRPKSFISLKSVFFLNIIKYRISNIKYRIFVKFFNTLYIFWLFSELLQTVARGHTRHFCSIFFSLNENRKVSVINVYSIYFTHSNPETLTPRIWKSTLNAIYAFL